MNRSVLKDSYHTLTANIVNQAIGVVIFLILPNILSIGDYAVTVYVSILLYYAGFADLGTVQVYSRKAPGLIAHGDPHEVISLEDSVQLLWHIVTFLYAFAAAAFFYRKFGSVLNTLMIFTIINLTPLFTFYLQKKTVRGGFPEFKRLTIVQSLSKVFVLAGAYIASLHGWFAGSIVGIFAVNLYTRDETVFRINLRANPSEAVRHIPEGIILALIMMIWGTLLMLGRVYAALICPEDVVAQYGIINSGFQVISSAVIAIFLPVTVKIYTLCAGAVEDLLWFIMKLQLAMTPVMTVVAFMVADLSGVLFSAFFTKYSFDFRLIRLVMLSLLSLPVLVTAGSVLIGKQMAKPYFLAISVVLSSSFLFLMLTKDRFHNMAPAITQLSFLMLTALGLLLLVWYLFYEQKTFRTILISLSPLFIIIILSVINYLLKFCGAMISANAFLASALSDLIMFTAVLFLMSYVYRRTDTVQQLELWFKSAVCRHQ